MDSAAPEETIIAQGGAQGLAAAAELLATKGIEARIVAPPGYNPNQ